MKYDAICLARFVRDIPYLDGRDGFPGQLWRLVNFLDVYSRYLPLADQLRVERLDPLYTHARCLAAFDAAMLDDLVTAFGWRGLARGAWLAALKADGGCRATLEDVVSDGLYPYQTGVVRLALNELNGHADPALAESHRRISMLREAIRQIPAQPFKLLAHDPDLHAKIYSDRLEVARIYSADGAEAASAFARSRPWSYVLEPASPGRGETWHWGFIG
jgi:hypothetical protein